MKKRYYIVTAKCGHVGKNRCIEIDFAVRAKNSKEAARFTRTFPRVKHHHKDAIREVRQVSYQEYHEQYARNEKDPYLRSGNIQEQRRRCPNLDRRIQESKPNLEDDPQARRKRRITYMMKKRQIENEINLSSYF